MTVSDAYFERGDLDSEEVYYAAQTPDEKLVKEAAVFAIG